MDKSESKYFNTALLMDEAMLSLLDKKDFGFITVKEICQKAGVNRSTFYLHYTSPRDILEEIQDRLNARMLEIFLSYGIKDDAKNPSVKTRKELFFLNEKYLTPYLEFVRENQKPYRAIFLFPELFDGAGKNERLFKNVVSPICDALGVPKKRARYISDFYIKGIMSVVIRWVNGGCKEENSEIIEILKACVRPGL